jgi:hypothetical protein
MPTVRRIYKQGNSFVLTLPEHLLEGAGLHEGDHVFITPIDNVALCLYGPVELPPPETQDTSITPLPLVN